MPYDPDVLALALLELHGDEEAQQALLQTHGEAEEADEDEE